VVPPLDGSDGHISGQVVCDGAQLDWPALDLRFQQLHAFAGFAGHGEAIHIGAGRAWALVDGGSISGSLTMSTRSDTSEVVGVGRGLHLHDDLLARLQDLSGQQPWGRHLAWSGTLDLLAKIDPLHPDVLDAHVDFRPLHLDLPQLDEELGFVMRGRIGVRGEITADGSSNFPQFRAKALTLTGAGVDLEVHDMRAFLDEVGMRVSGSFGSVAGVDLASRLPLLVNEGTMAALEEIGLSGKMRAAEMMIDLTLPYDGSMNFKTSGSLVVEEIGLRGGLSPLTGGTAAIEVRSAYWNGPEDFAAALDFHDGTAKVSGLTIKEATAHMQLTPERVVWTDVDAKTLGGRLHSNGVDRDGNKVRGWFRLDLEPEAPIGVNCFVTDLQLSQLREELGFDGPLAGNLDGYLRIASPSPSPTFAQGRGWFHINGGALGTVPVLKSIWRFAGISPPIFDEGDLFFRANGKGRLLIDEFSLQHPLLRVTGKGSMDMDTNLSLKVTLRTLGFVGRLPLLKDLLDFLVEQQVYGPDEAPIITHRASGKLLGEDFQRPPFPLWVPAPPLPDWRISPIFPVE
jgi:hypothetical protein